MLMYLVSLDSEGLITALIKPPHYFIPSLCVFSCGGGLERKIVFKYVMRRVVYARSQNVITTALS